MSQQESLSLGQKLSPLLGGGLFRPLSRPTAAVYVDCAERLVEAADEGGQIPHGDARLLIREVLVRHPDVELEEDEGGQFRDLNQRAAQFFSKLLEVRWLQTRRVSLDEHYVLIAPPLRRVLRVLRDLGADRPADLRDFAATLRSLCNDLLREGVLDPNRLGPEEMRQTVKDFLDRAGRAEDQMHAVESLIDRHDLAQRSSATPRETLERFLVEFHAGDHMVCYDALQAAGLLPRLNQARATVRDALHDPFTRQRLADGLARHLDLSAPAAYAEAEAWLARLERLLNSIPVKQRTIDGRMADFARLSNARHRYQTEMRGRRPEQVKSYLDEAGQRHAGTSFAALAADPGMPLLSPKVEFFFGLEAMSSARRQRPPVNLDLLTQTSRGESDAAREEIRRRNLNVLSAQRAVRFVEKHLPTKGDRISTEQLRVTADEDFLDLLAVLAFDRGPSGTEQGSVRWRVQAVRAEWGLEPARIPRDAEGGRLVERFTLERLS